MVAIALLLGLLGLELIRGLDASRLARRAGLVAAATFLALTCWNHEAWIARQNVGGSGTGRLDTSYLVWHLSPNAVPALVDALAGLPAGPRHDL
jgi:hypothetical protein